MVTDSSVDIIRSVFGDCLRAGEMTGRSEFTNPEVSGYVGFANLPNQVHRKSVKKGFEFTMMVVGESGLGKSTLVNSLFFTDMYPERQAPMASDIVRKTVKIESSTVEIEERGVKLRLTVVDTPGFGDSIDSSDCFKPIVEYIDNQFEKYFRDESGLNRRNIADNRIHCCFYFINPAAHGLRPLDVQFMKTLHNKVNLVPVIAKSDTLTRKEVVGLKMRVLTEIAENGIRIYQLPDCDADEDDEYRQQVRQLKDSMPFAICGSTQQIEVQGRKVRGRQYPWGVIDIENPEHCDFIKLRAMLVTHMQDLEDMTHESHYENYRSCRLAGQQQLQQSGARAPGPLASTGAPSTAGPASTSDQLSEKDRQLQEKEMELKRMQDMLSKMQAQIAKSSSSSLQSVASQ